MHRFKLGVILGFALLAPMSCGEEPFVGPADAIDIEAEVDDDAADVPSDAADLTGPDVDMDEDGADSTIDAQDAVEDLGDAEADGWPWDWSPDTVPDWPQITPAQLQAGTADGTLDLPVGVPLAAYTARARFASAPIADGRDSSYAVGFVPSTGVQTRIPIHVVWLQAGGQQAVLVKIDLAYSFDGLTRSLEAAISQATGEDVTDRVFYFTAHTHSSYGDFSQAHMLFLGHDRFNREIFERITAQATELAAIAHDRLEPAAIGVGIDPQFDPDHLIFRSRRSAHYGLVDAFGVEVEPGYKDPSLYLVRIDASQGTEDPTDDEPMAILFNWGMHGTIMDYDNYLVTSEGTGAVELKLENHFDHPITLVHMHGNTGDMSSAGTQSAFAKMESIGERAAPKILALWESVETTSQPLRLEALVRTIPQGRDIRVTRNGTVDLYYLPYDPTYQPDLEVFGEDGLSLNPYDEFLAQYGAIMCGDPEMEFPFVSMEVYVEPYSSCALVEGVAALIPILFETHEYYPLEYPTWETRSTMIGALGLDSVPVTVMGEESRVEPVVLGFLPGEVCTLLGRAFQWRMSDEMGIEASFVVGFALDHEGYLLTVEDWMRGGYEPAITTWGPLQGEYILDSLVELTHLLQTDIAEHPAYPDYRDQEYPYWPLEPVAPDAAPGCGTVPDILPDYLWSRDGWEPPQAQPETIVRRVSDVAHFVFLGGDPAIDLPVVRLQNERTPGAEDYEDVLLPNGEPLTDRGYDMILSYTPDPLNENAGPADRHHYWLVEWQAVSDRPSLDDMAGLPLGRYRFAAQGVCPDQADDEYPYQSIPYEVVSESFEVTGDDALTVEVANRESNLVTLAVAYRTAQRGFRLLHLASDYRTSTPLVAGGCIPLVVVELLPAGAQGSVIETWYDLTALIDGDRSLVQVDMSGQTAGEYSVRVFDGYGNNGTGVVTVY